MSDPEDDLLALLDDLADTLDALREELDAEDATERRTRRADRGVPARDPMPRRPTPPRPGEFVRFTEEYTIPTLIAFLEANVRALELLRGVLRLAGGRGLPATDRENERVATAGRRALDGVDAVLDDLQDAFEGRPTDENARTLFDDARALRREIDDAIAGRTIDRDARTARAYRDRDRGRDRRPRRDSTDPISIAVTDETADDEDETDGEASAASEVDVDAELDAIRRDVRPDEDDDASGDDSNRSSGRRPRDDGDGG
ncbi:DUF7547 family protein [Halomarina pelagica]|uniref:DUF7547 family protein n=1 Tax=Halomarina pelagica TaxID=2961599 RepID=UPI0020C46DF3|nr:hypothetical protein [Halomarina sp. BND7]